MNVYDAHRMADALEADGLVAAGGDDAADVIVLNTCHIREKAAEKVYSEIGRIASGARENGRARPTIVVAGCVAQAEGAEMIARAPAIDIVIGPQAYHRLPALLRAQEAGARGQVDLDMPVRSKFEALPPVARRSAPSAFLTIQEGCDKFCAFCVVPYTRGAEVSRPLGAILAEAERLIDQGAVEITLLGQNVNAWSDPVEKVDFAGLLARVASLSGLRRLRYMTSHPRDVTEGMIRAHGAIEGLMPFLHLPVQSGSDRVLAAMNRRHDRAFYRDMVRRFRAVRPDLALSSDFIVGFPGETDTDFEDTLSLCEEIGYAQAFSFCYSPRPGTPAADRGGQVAAEVSAERLQRLQERLRTDALAFNAATVGRTCPVLVERPGRKAGQWIGKSPWLQSVVIEDPALRPGQMVDVVLVAAGPNSLTGQQVEQRDMRTW
jgi:tRNA-2-methylthio-N6-dimethylallyladenosine synthase